MKGHSRLYSLYEKQGSRWMRISSLALPLGSAVRVFQSALLAYALDGWPHPRRLKVVGHSLREAR